MTERTVEQQLERSRKRLAELRSRSSEATEERQTLFDAAMEELSASLEELAVMSEELRQQNDEIMVVRDDLSRERARYKDLFQMAPDGYIVTDPQGVIQELNEAAFALLQVRETQDYRLPLRAFLPSQSSARFSGLLEESRKASKILTGELELRPASGSGAVHVTVTALSVRDRSGAVTGIRWMLHDITERRQAEEELRRYSQDLKRSNEDLQQFAYVASHDLQEPLRGVVGHLGLLRKNCKDQLDERGQEYIAFVESQTKKMSAMVADLLEYSRAGMRQEHVTLVDTQAVFNESLKNLKGSIAKRGAIITSDPLPSVRADGGQLPHLFQNLIGNAIKFRGERPPEIHVGAREEGGKWVFSVRDNGIGIAPEHQKRIFTIFQRLNRDGYEGTGIGLAICKKIVERHGGRIWLESEVGEGTTFFFSLPR